MLRKFLHAKIHHATATRCDPDYVGSITIDANLLEATGIRPNEAVMVLDVDNAARFETYVILGERGSGKVEVNGPAARLTAEGHRLIVLAFGFLDGNEVEPHEARVVICGEDNSIAEARDLPSTLDAELYVPA